MDTVSGKGKLLTYTVIHVAPTQFQNLAPYTVGILKLRDGLKIPGMIQEITQEQLQNRHDTKRGLHHMQHTAELAAMAQILPKTVKQFR